MKKAFVLVFVLICFGATAMSQTATGYCSLPGGEDYVNVDYYNDGHLSVSINTEKTITNLHITVTCTEKWIEIEQVYQNGRYADKKTPREKTHTLCDQTYYENQLLSNRTNKIEEGVKRMNEQSSHQYQYTVSVSNPRCK